MFHSHEFRHLQPSGPESASAPAARADVRADVIWQQVALWAAAFELDRAEIGAEWRRAEKGKIESELELPCEMVGVIDRIRRPASACAAA